MINVGNNSDKRGRKNCGYQTRHKPNGGCRQYSDQNPASFSFKASGLPMLSSGQVQ